MIAINSVEDHIHIFVGILQTISVSNQLKILKYHQQNLLKIKDGIKINCNWQDGYGAFSYSRSHIDKVVKYIMSQEVHHHKHSFSEEYKDFMEKFGVEYDEKYLLDV